MSEPGTLAKDGNQPPADGGFWGFSLALYGRPGAAEACLALQDRFGADVTLLLLGFWRAHKGFPGWAEGELARAAAMLAPVNEVLRPLRQARRALKALQADEPAAPDLYAEMKALELRLEQVAQVWALGACHASPAPRAQEMPARNDEIAAAALHLSACIEALAPGDPQALRLGAALLDAVFA
jgi:uncharacterized protein (TIGR02444 family)